MSRVFATREERSFRREADVQGAPEHRASHDQEGGREGQRSPEEGQLVRRSLGPEEDPEALRSRHSHYGSEEAHSGVRTGGVEGRKAPLCCVRAGDLAVQRSREAAREAAREGARTARCDHGVAAGSSARHIGRAGVPKEEHSRYCWRSEEEEEGRQEVRIRHGQEAAPRE